jgi:hypothetical protein
MTKSLKAAALRINKRNKTTHIEYQSDLGSKGARGNQPWKARARKEFEAGTPASDLFDRPTYKTGDGDVIGFRRPGSDLSYIKSLGIKA